MNLSSIGSIHTPYKDTAPFRPDKDSMAEFSIVVDPRYREAISGLESFSHIIVFFYFNQSKKTNLRVHPPHLNGEETGLFASRSPNRLNKIGMDIVKIIRIQDNVIYTSPMDILNDTPLLDIKPYIPQIDSFPEASSGHTF